MDNYKSNILTTENQWLDRLYEYCKNIFSTNNIPSHNHTHHLRVWEYSKEILHALNESIEIKSNLVESCLIASFFHDTGLTITLDKNHGKESRAICEQFFENNTLQKPKSFNEILSALEMHDDKEYKQDNNTPNSLLSILCNADDLDAFGNIGVIRYTEIYLLRGIELPELSKLVIENLDNRFANFERTYLNFANLYQKHKARYLITRKFFEDLQIEFK